MIKGVDVQGRERWVNQAEPSQFESKGKKGERSE